MSKKLSGNGLWESSRMMLPQHKEASLQLKIEESKIIRPVLGEEEITNIASVIGACFSRGSIVTLQLYSAYQQIEIKGIIKRYDQTLRRLRIEEENGELNWIYIENITRASEDFLD